MGLEMLTQPFIVLDEQPEVSSVEYYEASSELKIFFKNAIRVGIFIV